MASADFAGQGWDVANGWVAEVEDPLDSQNWESEECGGGGTTTTGLVLERGLVLVATIVT